MTKLDNIPWQDVVAVAIRTTADGPFFEDVFWRLETPRGVIELPGAMVQGPVYDDFVGHMPGADFAKVIEAMGSTEEATFPIWRRDA